MRGGWRALGAAALLLLGVGASRAEPSADGAGAPASFAGLRFGVSSQEMIATVGAGGTVHDDNAEAYVEKEVDFYGVKLTVVYRAMKVGGFDQFTSVRTPISQTARPEATFPSAQCAEVWAKLSAGLQKDYGPGVITGPAETLRRTLKIKVSGFDLRLRVNDYGPEGGCNVELSAFHDLIPYTPPRGPDGKPWTSTTIRSISGFGGVPFNLSRSDLMARLGTGATLSADGRSVTAAGERRYYRVPLPVSYELAGDGDGARFRAARAVIRMDGDAQTCELVWQVLRDGLTDDYGTGDQVASTGTMGWRATFDKSLEIRAGNGASAKLRVQGGQDCRVELAVQAGG